MDRFLTQIRFQSLLFLSPNRQLYSFKPNSFNLKSRSLLNLLNQSDTSKQNSSISSSDVNLTYESNSLFPLPEHVGFSHETKLIPKFDSNHYNKSFQEKDSIVSQLINNNKNNLEIRTYDCPSSLHHLFLNYNILTQPLTAIIITFKTNSDMSTWSIEVENERNQLTEEFIKLAHEIYNYLNTKQYWVDFIDPSNGKPYYGPPTSDVLFETDERCRDFGINIIDLGCCRVIEHLKYGTHVFVGCIFTNAPKTDSHVQYLLKEFVSSNCSKQE